MVMLVTVPVPEYDMPYIITDTIIQGTHIASWEIFALK